MAQKMMNSVRKGKNKGLPFLEKSKSVCEIELRRWVRSINMRGNGMNGLWRKRVSLLRSPKGYFAFAK